MLWFGSALAGRGPGLHIVVAWAWRDRAVGAWARAADGLHVVVVVVNALCATVWRFGCWVGCLYRRGV